MADNVNGIDQSPAVVAQNSSDNYTLGDVIGNKTDTHAGDSIYSILEVLKDHNHSACNVYPYLAGGVQITGHATAYTLGAFAVIVPASTITSPFDIHHIVIEDISATGIYVVSLYAAEVLIGSTKVIKAAAQDSTDSIPFQTALIPANTQIQAKIASSSGGGDTITLSVKYHEY